MRADLMTYDPWTPERVQRLRDLWASEARVTNIARELKTSRNAVVSKAHRLGLPARLSTIKRRST
jgi:GcrA cell cycle regulator